MTFLSLLSMNLVTVWPLYAVAIVTLIIVARRHKLWPGNESHPPLYLLVLPLVLPFLLTLWAALTVGAKRGARSGSLGWASGVLTALALVAVGAASWSVWRWRSRWLPAGVCAVVSILCTAYAWFVGAMAIADDWL